MPVKVIYKSESNRHRGRDGSARSDDGSVDVKGVIPKEMRGDRKCDQTISAKTWRHRIIVQNSPELGQCAKV